MVKRQVFYSFHYGNDVMRVAQIRSIGSIEDNKPVAENAWEAVRRGSDAAIRRWIDENMKYRSCVIVMVGTETANRPWVRYEIEKAWEDGKGLFGIHIHNLKCPRNGVCAKGVNPFDTFNFKDGRKLSSVVKCYDPSSRDAYNDIRMNLGNWVEQAIAARK